MATDLNMSILAYFNGHPASDVRQWFRKFTRHAHLLRIVDREVYLLGCDKPHALYRYSKPVNSAHRASSPQVENYQSRYGGDPGWTG